MPPETPSKPTDPLTISLGRTILARRLALGLTQAQLAERAGMYQSRIAVLETGLSPNPPSLRTLSRLAAALGLICDVRFLPEPQEPSRWPERPISSSPT